MNRKISITFTGLLGVGLVLITGCGPSRPETAPVNGHVTFQGKPVSTGQIMFQPEHGRPAIGTINPDGTYRLTTFQSDDGALPGRHRVTIEAKRITGPKGRNNSAAEAELVVGPPQIEWLAPEIYAFLQSTPLTAEVKKGNNVIDFDLSASK
jgi:hypothetical protein